MPLDLLIRAGDGSERIVLFDSLTLPCTLGRDPDLSQVVISDGQTSRAHCRISRVGADLWVEDLGSRNGTWIEGERIHRAVWPPGQTLRVGNHQITLEEPPEEEPEDNVTGKTIEGFALEEVLGRGRYGTVYRATQIALGRPVAIKVLAEEYRRDPAKVEAFLTEARRAGRLNHPNVVQVHDVVVTGSHCLLVMEQMAGSASEQLQEHGPFAEEAVLILMRDIGEALAYAESQRLVHRDVKPDNILVNGEGVYKLADLGIATPIDADGRAVQDRVFGSPHYVAPEQARGGSIDGRADLYALGASVWHLATGKPLWSGTTRQLVNHHLSSPLPDLRSLATQLSPRVAALIVQLLAKDPGQRPAGATELVETVRSLMANPRMRTVPVPSRRRLRRRRRR